VAKRYILQAIQAIAKGFEEVNRTLPAGNAMVQLLTFNTDPERHSEQWYRRTDGQTDDVMIPVAVRSAKN